MTEMTTCPTCGALPCDQVTPAAALRQSPSVDEVARVILDGVFEGFEHGQCEKEWEPDYGKEIARVTAENVNRLYRGSKE